MVYNQTKTIVDAVNRFSSVGKDSSISRKTGNASDTHMRTRSNTCRSINKNINLPANGAVQACLLYKIAFTILLMFFICLFIFLFFFIFVQINSMFYYLSNYITNYVHVVYFIKYLEDSFLILCFIRD